MASNKSTNPLIFHVVKSLHEHLDQPQPQQQQQVRESDGNQANAQQTMSFDNPVFVFDEVDWPRVSSPASPTYRRSSLSPMLRLSPGGAGRNKLTVPVLPPVAHRRFSTGDARPLELAVLPQLTPLQRQESIYSFDSNETDPELERLRSVSAYPSRRGTFVASDDDNHDQLGDSQSLASISTQLKDLVRQFHERTQRVKAMIERRDSIESEISEVSQAAGSSALGAPVQRMRLQSLVVGSEPSVTDFDVDVAIVTGLARWKLRALRKLRPSHLLGSIDPQGKAYVVWLFTVTAFFIYNCVTITIRASFPYWDDSNRALWLAFDYLADFVYLLDIILVRIRIKFLQNGIYVEGKKEMAANYIKTIAFKLDLLCLLPLDFFYLLIGWNSLLRLPRLFKIRAYWECFDKVDKYARSLAHFVRIARTMTYMLYLIHVVACIFYSFSVMEGIGSNGFVYDGNGHEYIRCFYFAFKLSTSIGNNPAPETNAEYMFMTVSWLMAAFIFATLVGQIRNIFHASGANMAQYKRRTDMTIEYMKNLKLPEELQTRVRTWFTFNWEQQKTLDERETISVLPLKMNTDVAINVHFETLCKVQLFQDCDKNLLRVLVLKLKPVLYLPGDYICRKGEVGKEMFIVSKGQVVVIANEKIVATLKEGSVLGEISLLALSGGNRRTADVVSNGFSNLFLLLKEDLNEALKDYPEAEKVLRRKAKKILQPTLKVAQPKALKEEHNEELIIKERSPTPRLLSAVLQVAEFSQDVSRLLVGKTKEDVDEHERSQKAAQVEDEDKAEEDHRSRQDELELKPVELESDLLLLKICQSLPELNSVDETVAVAPKRLRPWSAHSPDHRKSPPSHHRRTMRRHSKVYPLENLESIPSEEAQSDQPANVCKVRVQVHREDSSPESVDSSHL